MRVERAMSMRSQRRCCGHGRFRFIGVFCAILATLAFSASAHSALFEDSMSMDATPIEFEMAGARYRIPRNYIYSMDDWSGGPQKNVSLRMVVPGLKPFSPETKDCMLRTARPPCRVYDVEMVPDFTTSEVGFENSKRHFIESNPKRGMYGFEVYQSGPESARIEYYRKMVDSRAINFKCLIGKIERKTYRICDHVSKTRTGAHFYYHFSGDDGLKDAVEIGVGVRDLIDSFYIGNKK